MGNVRMFGRDNGGVDVDFEEAPDADPGATRLLLDASVGVGEVGVNADYLPLDGENTACENTGDRASG
jgi:hypothetical protein